MDSEALYQFGNRLQQLLLEASLEKNAELQEVIEYFQTQVEEEIRFNDDNQD